MLEKSNFYMSSSYDNPFTFSFLKETRSLSIVVEEPIILSLG